jgi:hypothetical protein
VQVNIFRLLNVGLAKKKRLSLSFCALYISDASRSHAYALIFLFIFLEAPRDLFTSPPNVDRTEH